GGGGGGAEERRGLLAGPFEPLLDLIGGTGGDVLKFAGDALLACWPAEGHNAERALAGATASAAGCAEAMQTILDRYAAAKRLPLALRIGIGAGEVVVLDVGGERDRGELLAAGEAVPQTPGAAERAQPGLVAFSPAALDLLERGLAGPPAPAVPARDPVEVPGALVAPYLPPPMRA